MTVRRSAAEAMKRRTTTTRSTWRLRRISTRFGCFILGCAVAPTSNAFAQDDDTSSSDPSDDTSLTMDEDDASKSSDPDSVRLEILYKPVSDLQIAVWLEDGNGEHLRDIFVTQATGTLGIGNRPGIWNFLSSWRAPYGPRPSVLPVWAHRRSQRYPKVVFHDAMTTDSLGFHERTSSAENYFCRPLTQSEQDAIIDTMTCPSPQVFQTDKGRFDPEGDESVYPPRNDLVEFEEEDDHADAQLFDQLNDLDSISGATPTGDQIQRLSVTLSRADLDAMGVEGNIYAWIEVNLENDQNDHFSFDRENDHFVDRRLREYGVPYLGQPAVSYRVEIDPKKTGLYSTDAFAGYADWDGKTGTLHPADGKISTTNGSGAGRLLSFKQGEETARVLVQVDAATDSDETGCTDQSLPAVQDLRAHEIGRAHV